MYLHSRATAPIALELAKAAALKVTSAARVMAMECSDVRFWNLEPEVDPLMEAIQTWIRARS